MIVRDAAEILPACLESVKAVVDEILVADTGSVDNSVDLARQLGARVISIPWTKDFAAARNLALRQVRSDWVLVLDADEMLDSSAASHIPGLLSNSSYAGYQVTIRNYVLTLNDRVWDRPAIPNDNTLPASAGYPAFVEHQNVRLFRNNPDLYFVGRVHESVGPRILELRRNLGQANFLIHHFGLAASEETRARKNIFYRDLGRQKILEMPQNAQAHLELGLLELDNFRNFEEARRLFARACDLDPRFGLAWFFQGLSFSKLEQHEPALRCFAEAERLRHRTALVAEFAGDACYNLSRFPKAIEFYKTASQRDRAHPALESKLGLALVRAGRAVEGLRLQHQALRRAPAQAEIYDRLILSFVWLERLPDAAQTAAAKLDAVDSPTPTDFLRAASLLAKAEGASSSVTAILSRGLQLHPQNENLLIALREVLGLPLTPQSESATIATKSVT